VLFSPQIIARSRWAPASGSGGGAPASAYPLTLLTSAVLKGWYEGDLLAGAGGSTITTWPDQSTNGNDATQSVSANRPTVAAADLNGMNVVRFTSADTNSFDLPDLLSGASEGSAMAVIKVNADPPGATADSGGLLKIGSQGGANGSNHYPFTDNNVYDDFGSTARKSLGNPTPSLASYRILSFHSKASDWRCYIDATSFFTTATNTAGFTSSPKIATSTNGVTSVYLNGWVAELLICNNFLTDSDRQKLEGYIAWKWGINANLPGGHPYLAGPP
jgi:hypothetical protein